MATHLDPEASAMAAPARKRLARSAASIRVKSLSSGIMQDEIPLHSKSEAELTDFVTTDPVGTVKASLAVILAPQCPQAAFLDPAAQPAHPNHHVLKELLQAQRFSSAMLDMNVALMETNDLTQLMTNIMQHAADLMDCERCSIFM
ncbi:uncharacterized protein MONBRDRAFT_23049, partial [Monosiga brevicollis MX1]